MYTLHDYQGNVLLTKISLGIIYLLGVGWCGAGHTWTECLEEEEEERIDRQQS